MRRNFVQQKRRRSDNINYWTLFSKNIKLCYTEQTSMKNIFLMSRRRNHSPPTYTRKKRYHSPNTSKKEERSRSPPTLKRKTRRHRPIMLN
ncbi:uncharacterized protein LOC133547097 isoform X2 [Nerophis ophidion]|uniref:uncharacterized protein LOC133547097 isoform X2 n=1 Tax=Nerophis ophidion TaxID=159077 RepID=UPI002ADF4CFE|nr:uncharacterized protein LOC133547097 isoform X2 [Nerophis ophidion]